MRPAPIFSFLLSFLAVAGSAPGAALAQDQPAGLTIRSPWSGASLSAHFTVSVKSYYDRDPDLSRYKTFAFEYASKTDPLLEKDLVRECQARLEARGLTRDDANAQLAIRILFTVQSAGEEGWAKYVQLNFLDRAELISGKEQPVPPVVWKGEVVSAGPGSDIRKVAPFMFTEVLDEFPAPSGRSEKRQWFCHQYGDIGVAIDRTDWHVIRSVRSGSPAALAGVRETDRLEKINDASMSWRMTYHPEREKWPLRRENWVQSNHLYIRESDRNGQAMVLRLKAADGKTRTVTVPMEFKEECGPAKDILYSKE